MDFSNAPEGATYYHETSKLFAKKAPKSDIFFIFADGEWVISGWQEHQLTPIPHQSYMPAVGEWSGEGLPPEKYLIEAMVHGKWEKCKVLITDDNHQECAVMVIRNAELAWADNFRPLPTEEEVEREKAIDGLLLIIDPDHKLMKHETARFIATQIVDAGYRPQESE